MNLKDLQKEIPYQWRVQSFSKYNATATCVAYIDARDVMNLLDEVVGAEHWADDYKLINGKLFAGIAIQTDTGWVWKWDVGSVTDIEAEKGEASDSFKRAAVKWGVGRFLYSLEIKKVATNGPKTEQNKYPYVIDDQGNRVFDLTAHINRTKGNIPLSTPTGLKSQNLPSQGHPSPADQMREGMAKATNNEPRVVPLDPQAVTTPYCPVHTIPAKLIPAGVSKKTGRPYAAFYACPEQDCKVKPIANPVLPTEEVPFE